MNQFAVLIVACIVAFVAAECPSACSGHGTCGAYDACACFRNWMSNDCSERVCPFGLAHVDTPLGDLDSSSGMLTGPGTTGANGGSTDTSIIVNDVMYPSGTTEQFPAMKDSSGTVATHSAHYYRECSNKGICDRSSGECECFDGYDGSSCQRASCPASSNGVCSGHGTCKTIQELSAAESENIYRLWDEDITMGCQCDAGYEGPDCSSRVCKIGVDPLYADDFANIRHANYTLQFYVMNDDAEIYGNYSLVFTDAYGEDWQTEPIDIDANCATVQDRLETIPNDVIPWGSVKCYKSEETLHVASDTTTSGQTNAGDLTSLNMERDALKAEFNALTFTDLLPGTYYNVPLTTSGSGTGAQATVVITIATAVESITITSPGTGYAAADTLGYAALSIGTATLAAADGAALAAADLNAVTSGLNMNAGALTSIFAGTTRTGMTAGTYTNVVITGGTGSGAKATIVVTGATTIGSVVITTAGTGYVSTDSDVNVADGTLGVGSASSTDATLADAHLGTTNAGMLGLNHNNIAKDGQKDSESVRTFTGALQYSSEANTAGELVYSAYNYSIVNKFVLAFPGNPGEIPPLKINRYLDGKRPTLFSTEKEMQTLGVHIYANGFHGESTDYVNDECEGVLVGLASDQVTSAASVVADGDEKLTHYLKIDDNLQFERLKRCLGDADGIASNNVEVYDWDYGNFMNPHLIKLVDATQDRFTEYVRADGTSYKVLAHGDTPIGTGDGWESFPMTKLCNRGEPWLNDNYLAGSAKHKLLFQDDKDDATNSGGSVFNRGTHGWCKNPNPPGFFAIIYFDDCTDSGVSRISGYLSGGDTTTDSASGAAVANLEACSLNRKGFRVLTRAALDYATTTKFHVFTTKGTLQQVSQHSAAYTSSYDEKYNVHDGTNSFGTLNRNFIHDLHSPVIHVANTTYTGAQGQVDCETAYDYATGVTKYGALDCLNKGDKIFLINLGDRDASNCEGARSNYKNIAGNPVGAADSCFYKSTANSLDTNPMYPNMYTIKKIGKIAKDVNKADSTSHLNDASNQAGIHGEAYRHQITLDTGVNTMYMHNGVGDRGASTNRPDLKATMYKFHPPALNSTGTTGFNYIGACSNRGICNGDDGVCECFEGYTGDNCANMNSLAQ